MTNGYFPEPAVVEYTVENLCSDPTVADEQPRKRERKSAKSRWGDAGDGPPKRKNRSGSFPSTFVPGAELLSPSARCCERPFSAFLPFVVPRTTHPRWEQIDMGALALITTEKIEIIRGAISRRLFLNCLRQSKLDSPRSRKLFPPPIWRSIWSPAERGRRRRHHPTTRQDEGQTRATFACGNVCSTSNRSCWGNSAN